MKKLSLTFWAVGSFIAGFMIWLTGGAHASWTVSSTTTMMVDEFTGLEYPVIRDGLVPGIEFLVAGFSLMALLFVVEFFLMRKRLG